MTNSIFTINTIAEAINTLNTIKAGGQYATILAETEVKLNKKASDTKERIAEDFHVTKSYKVEFNFGKDYDKAMSKLLNTDYHASDANRVHIIKNLLMQFVSTGNYCLIYMPNSYVGETEYFVNGKPMTAEQKAYMERFRPARKASTLAYRNVGLKNVKRLIANHNEYVFNLRETATNVA